MKKNRVIALLAAAALCVPLTACGITNASSAASSSTATTSSNASVSSSDSSSAVVSSETESSEIGASSALPKETFAKGLYTSKEFILKIKKYKVIKVGEKGNENGDKPIIVFWYDVTNLSGKDMDSSDAWILEADIKAVQDNDPNAVNELNTGICDIEDSSLKNENNKIKKGGTVTAHTTYELSDTKTPVKLTASNSDGEVGTTTYKI